MSNWMLPAVFSRDICDRSASGGIGIRRVDDPREKLKLRR